MKTKLIFAAGIAVIFTASLACAQEQQEQPDDFDPLFASGQGLQVKALNRLPGTIQGILGIDKCDAAGNIYLRPRGVDGDANHSMMQTPIQEFLPDGKLRGRFRITDAQPELIGRDFAVTATGEIYQAALAPKGELFVVVFGQDGSVISRIPAELKFAPYHLARFPSGEFLLSGVTGGRGFIPATAVFDAHGKLIKRIVEPEDEESRRKAEAGDRDFISLSTNAGNVFVQRGDATAGSDGNVYLMRSGYEALIYVISPKGEVVRKLRVAPTRRGALPMRIREFQGKLAITFGYYDQRTRSFSLKVVDLEGNPVADYEDLPSSLSLACYSSSGLDFIQGGIDSGVRIVHVIEAR